MRHLIVALILATGLLAGHDAAAACLRAYGEGQVVNGRLAKVRIGGDGGYYYLLRLRRTACLQSDDGSTTSSRRIQVYSVRDPIRNRMSRLAGKAVRVQGMPRPPSRPFHRAPITMRVDAISRR